jgi:hypothetical protein
MTLVGVGGLREGYARGGDQQPGTSSTGTTAFLLFLLRAYFS